jgi:hypothetical protein
MVLPPPGKGMDSHRTWELLLLGEVPIVEHSKMDFMWASGDLPVLAVDDLLHLPSKEKLESLYEERFGLKMADFKREKMSRQFWHDKFDTFRREHLKDPNSGNQGRRRCWHGKPGLSPRAARQWDRQGTKMGLVEACGGCLIGHSNCMSACQAMGHAIGTCPNPSSQNPEECCVCGAELQTWQVVRARGARPVPGDLLPLPTDPVLR